MTAATMHMTFAPASATPIIPIVQEEKKKEKKPKTIKQAVGGIVIDTATNKILMLSSRKCQDKFRLPRGVCDKNETPEQALIRVLCDVAGIQVESVTAKIGTYVEANKKGKTVGHHWFFKVTNPTLLESWPSSDRQRVWFTMNEAIAASADRNISRLALNNCSLSQ